VITPDGAPVVEESRPSRLRAVAQVVRRQDDDATELLPIYRPHNAQPQDLQGVGRMPFADRLGMGRPMPLRPSLVRGFVQIGFQMIARDLDQLVQVLSSGWRKLAVENDERMARIDARLARMVARQHEWAAAEDGRVLAEAYAEGGTEQVAMLTPSLLAQMDARAKAGTAVAS
jgi:hypothetical protein